MTPLSIKWNHDNKEIASYLNHLTLDIKVISWRIVSEVPLKNSHRPISINQLTHYSAELVSHQSEKSY